MFNRIYYYFFYKLYKFWGLVSLSNFLGDFKSVISLITLELWLCGIVINIRSLMKNEKLEIDYSHPALIIPFIAIISVNYFSFVHTDKWKSQNEKFDNLPKIKNIVGGIIVWTIIISIIIVYWTSAYLVQRDVLRM